MKKCLKCGITLPDDATFCSKCGAKIEAPSPSQPSPPSPPPSQPPTPPAQPAPPVPPAQPPQKSGALKWVLIILAIIIILVLIAGAGCWFIGRKALKTIEQETAKFEQEGIIPSLEELSKEISKEEEEEVKEVEVKKEVKEPLVAPSEVVEPYMLYTLGTVPNSLVDYDIAKQYLTSEYKKEFTDASSVPLSYCIQQGPDDVRIKSEKISDSTATVRVSAQYGAEFGNPFEDMWDFKLMIQEGEWKISGIKCL